MTYFFSQSRAYAWQHPPRLGEQAVPSINVTTGPIGFDRLLMNAIEIDCDGHI